MLIQVQAGDPIIRVMDKSCDLTREEVLGILQSVPDPEIPVISVVELGVVRDVEITRGRVVVTMTPTYSGCPAIREMENDIRAALLARGLHDVEVRTILSPAWTTDWIGAEAREKLRRYGIAPPGPAEPEALVSLIRARRAAPCPFCGSGNTRIESEFGATACKAIHVCNHCRQPFEEFKAI